MLRCNVTGNPCGTDTVVRGRICPGGGVPCLNCITWGGELAWEALQEFKLGPNPVTLAQFAAMVQEARRADEDATFAHLLNLS